MAKRNYSFLIGRKKHKEPKYVRPHYDDINTYVKMLTDYFTQNYSNETIYTSDIDLAINKFKLKENSECWKIKEEIQRFVESHNQGLFVSKIKTNIIHEKKNLPLEEKVFSWNNVSFGDGKIEIRDGFLNTVAIYEIKLSKSAYNGIKNYFEIKFPDLEIRVINGKVKFNNEKRFKQLFSFINSNPSSLPIPDLVITPKSDVIRYFNTASEQEIKNYILHLKQQYLAYLCSKHIDKYKIRYSIERRVTLENDSTYTENAFLFTISESKYLIAIVYENTEDNRSSIVFFVRPERYEQAIENICSYFSSWECNKRETLANNYVDFKNSGIVRFNRIYHTDYYQWKRTIDSYYYSGN